MNRLKKIPVLRRDNRKRYFVPLKYPEIPLSADDLYVITTTGDRLDLLAYDYYGDEELWWVISRANPDVTRRDSFFIKSGEQIRIPSNPSQYVNTFVGFNNNNR